MSARRTVCAKKRRKCFSRWRAYAELADPMRRDALIKRREKMREAATVAAQPAALIDPEALWRSGRSLAAAGKLREALSSFELAAESAAQNGTYAAEAACCHYRLGVTPATAAIKLLKNAIRIEAEAYLDRASKLLPGDPRPAEAVKQLR